MESGRIVMIVVMLGLYLMFVLLLFSSKPHFLRQRESQTDVF